MKQPILGIAIKNTILTYALTKYTYVLAKYALSSWKIKTHREIEFPTHYYVGKLLIRSFSFL